MDAETIESSPMFIIEHKQYGAFLGRFKLLIVHTLAPILRNALSILGISEKS